MRILICDDDPADLQALHHHIETYMDNRQIRYVVTALSDPAELLDADTIYDLAILDIQMGHVDGITVAEALRRRNPKLALFFVTNYDSYQDDAMDLQAFRFFRKPFDPQRLYAGLDKAMEYIDGTYVDLYLADNGIHQRIIVDDILYVTRKGRKTALHTTGQVFCTWDKYDDFCEQLPQSFFYPVHKSFYVNLHYVERYSYTELILSDQTRIPIASRKQSAFHKFWFAYLRRR